MARTPNAAATPDVVDAVARRMTIVAGGRHLGPMVLARLSPRRRPTLRLTVLPSIAGAAAVTVVVGAAAAMLARPAVEWPRLTASRPARLPAPLGSVAGVPIEPDVPVPAARLPRTVGPSAATGAWRARAISALVDPPELAVEPIQPEAIDVAQLNVPPIGPAALSIAAMGSARRDEH